MDKKINLSLPVIIGYTVLLVAGVLLFVGLAQTSMRRPLETPALAVQEEPTLVAEVSETGAVPTVAETEAPAATEVLPTEAPTETVEPSPTATEAVAVNACIECHTDKDRLVALAKPDKPAEEESKGVG